VLFGWYFNGADGLFAMSIRYKARSTWVELPYVIRRKKIPPNAGFGTAALPSHFAPKRVQRRNNRILLTDLQKVKAGSEMALALVFLIRIAKLSPRYREATFLIVLCLVSPDLNSHSAVMVYGF